MGHVVGAWLDADERVWDPQQPHTDETYAEYLRWYLCRTHPYLTHAAPEHDEGQLRAPSLADTYPLHHD
jgi:hypothetical protein